MWYVCTLQRSIVVIEKVSMNWLDVDGLFYTEYTGIQVQPDVTMIVLLDHGYMAMLICRPV